MGNFRRFFDPSLIARTYRDPLTLAGFAVDVLPIIGILTLGWGATPLVALYWLENIAIGAATLIRMICAQAQKGRWAVLSVLFPGAFFTVHYGLFCFVHGIFLRDISMGVANNETSSDVFPMPLEIIDWALNAGPMMELFITAIAGVLIAHIVVDFRGEQSDRDKNLQMIQAGPYVRVVVLHVAIIFGAMFVFAAGEPLSGVLAILMGRIVWGIGMAIFRRIMREQKMAAMATAADKS